MIKRISGIWMITRFIIPLPQTLLQDSVFFFSAASKCQQFLCSDSPVSCSVSPISPTTVIITRANVHSYRTNPASANTPITLRHSLQFHTSATFNTSSSTKEVYGILFPPSIILINVNFPFLNPEPLSNNVSSSSETFHHTSVQSGNVVDTVETFRHTPTGPQSGKVLGDIFKSSSYINMTPSSIFYVPSVFYVHQSQ